MQKVVIVIPTYNESENIESLIIHLQKIFQKELRYKWHVLVVDDYSPDQTGEIVQKLKKKFKNITLISKQKEGLGAAYVFGMDYAIKNLAPDILVELDADWSHNPDLLPQFLLKIENGADFVVGSRYIAGGSIPNNWGLHRKIYSVTGNLIVRLGMGKMHPHDWTSGFRMLRAGVYKKVSAGLSRFSGYTFQVALLDRAIKAGFVIDEVPLKFIDRIHGHSKIAPSDYIKNLMLYILQHSIFLKYLVIGVGGFLIQTLISKLGIGIGFDPGIAVGIGSIFAIVCNFLGNNFWTFSHNKIVGFANYFYKFIHFLGTSIGAVIIQAVVVGVGVRFFGSGSWFFLMVFAIAFLVIPYNYFIYNKYIWKKVTPS